MPLAFSRAFASCKGGSGKSTLLFNVACAHAVQHPEQSVMIMDFSETGDISTVALGGFTGTDALGGKGKDMAASFASQHIATTDLIAAAAADVEDRQHLRKTMALALFLPPDAAQPAELEKESRLVQLKNVNPMLPDNMFMSVTSPDTASNDGFDSPAKRRAVQKGLMTMFANDDRDWAVFIDTDGDRAFTNRTKMGLLLAQFIAVPTEVDDNEFSRLSTFFEKEVEKMAAAGEIVPRIDMFILNKIQLHRWEEMKAKPQTVTSPFSPPKASVAEIDRLTNQLARFFCQGNVSQLPHQFWFPSVSVCKLSSTYGCPLVLMQEHLPSLKQKAMSEGWGDLTSIEIRDELVNAVKALATALEPKKAHDQGSNPSTPVKASRSA